MGCGCGRSQVTSPMHRTASVAAPVRDDVVYEVTYPNGDHEDFASETAAYAAIRLTGGGVKVKTKV